ncbi:phosphopantothenoylcysteine decarboxylase isoform X1 [Carcharodon carcharias]|uniref:phosphopantothenoylcysteine decarboxylase isoform X1 n=1 Tax=Carcharodon carcharias TaxID=13397 RepID=UPI001B7F6D1F|nr:phosphopantothenoylcysteine decarboxylase isoform X1 [Carcharodon carcharias]
MDGWRRAAMRRVLLAVSGSVAAVKLPELAAAIGGLAQVEVIVVTTEHAKHFYDSKDVPAKIYSDSDEWEMWKQRSDPVLHIDLRRWADLMVIAPLDANTLGKIASGICDNLLTCIVRAWDLKKPLLFCPAMNTVMWEHPITATQVQTLKSFGYIEVPCIEKKLMCGDKGGTSTKEYGILTNLYFWFTRDKDTSKLNVCYAPWTSHCIMIIRTQTR